ncbi:MAG TPA: hypothetical protein VLL25_16825, partial [Acidimicrobiales bacterium]|nr:hypothetical protein [Acidimicrobiales bacterium]
TATTAASSTTSSTAAASGAFASTDKVAVALNGTLLSAAEVQQVLKLPATPGQEQPGPNSTPQGPLNENGVLNVLPSAAVYKPLYDHAGGGVGANATYHLTSAKLDIGILTVKFATSAGGQSFIQKANNIVTTVAQGKATPHPDLGIGVLPANMQQVVRIPPSAIADPTNETIVIDFLYGNGVAYLIDLVAPPGTMTDQQIISLAKAQDAKYQGQKGTLGF